MASIFGASFADLRRALGLDDAPTRNLGVDVGSLGFGTDYLRSPEGAPAFYSLYASSLARQSPNLSRILLNRQGQLEGLYRAAAAADPQLQRDQFFRAFNPERFRKTLTPFERFERPEAFSRGYRLLGG